MKKVERVGLIIKEEFNFEVFWNEILILNFEKRYGVFLVYLVLEISMLYLKFFKNIR